MNRVDFLKKVIERGLGIYGINLISKMLEESGIIMDLDGNISFKRDEKKAIKTFFEKYSSLTPVAKMNLQMLARKYKFLL